jgi:hypothetical protein
MDLCRKEAIAEGDACWLATDLDGTADLEAWEVQRIQSLDALGTRVPLVTHPPQGGFVTSRASLAVLCDLVLQYGADALETWLQERADGGTDDALTAWRFDWLLKHEVHGTHPKTYALDPTP